MSKHKKIGAGLAAAGILASTLLLTGGTGAVAAPEGTERFIARTTEEGGSGDGSTIGDTFAFSGDLYRIGNRRNEVGRFGVVCTVTSVEEEEAQCVGTANVDERRGDEGQITVQGLVGNRGRSRDLAITGGTGDFENAGGTLTSRDLTDSIELLTFRFAD